MYKLKSGNHENINMTNQTVLSLLNYLCNEARNSVHASFGLMALCPSLTPDLGWQTCLDNSKSSADRLLRSIDDIRELLSTDNPVFDPAEEFDVTLCLGETIELLNLASGDRASRLVLQSAARSVMGRQHRRAVEQALMRVLDAVSKLGRKGQAMVTAERSIDGDGVRFDIVPANSNIALRVADWLNTEPDQVNFQDADDMLYGVATLVAGKRIRALGGTAEFVSDARAAMALSISIPWADTEGECHPQLPQQDETGLSVLVAEDSDESFVLTGILLQKESVWRARDGLEAIEMMKARRFDVVLMDIHMPGLDGYKAIRSMRDWETQTGNARTPIVVLSSDDIDTQMRSASQAGCSGFLRKPLDRHDLMDLLDRLKAVRTVSA
jgi:CheY-like chemotaxis protein